MQETATAAPGGPVYPVRFDVEYSENLSRWLIFVKWLLAIPHLIILYALWLVVYVIIVIAFFTILFTKKYPRGLFDFVVGVLRWQANVTAYVGLMRDEYPPFSWEPGKYPVTFEADYPQELSRFGPWYKWLLIIPNLIVLILVMLVAYVLWIIAFFAILFTGKFPRGMFDFIVGTLRWNARANAYAFDLLTDEYPPFSMK
ncbi:MAG: DUF4389 domain-containing protein [Dehalococcoidia bacterium]